MTKVVIDNTNGVPARAKRVLDWALHLLFLVSCVLLKLILQRSHDHVAVIRDHCPVHAAVVSAIGVLGELGLASSVLLLRNIPLFVVANRQG